MALTKADKFKLGLEKAIQDKKLKLIDRKDSSMIVAGPGRWPTYYTIFISEVENVKGKVHWSYNGTLVSGVSLDAAAHINMGKAATILGFTF
jgi:hypothetical protein